MLLNIEGVFMARIAWVILAENVERRIALGMFAIIAGGALLSRQGRLARGGAAGPLLVVATASASAKARDATTHRGVAASSTTTPVLHRPDTAPSLW